MRLPNAGMKLHDFGVGLMPDREPVRCKRCGVEMRRTGKTYPHVEFREPALFAFDDDWNLERPECVK